MSQSDIKDANAPEPIEQDGARTQQPEPTPQVRPLSPAAAAQIPPEEEGERPVLRTGRTDKASRVIIARLTEDELGNLLSRARREQLSRTDAIREAVREWSAQPATTPHHAAAAPTPAAGQPAEPAVDQAGRRPAPAPTAEDVAGRGDQQ
ncbi:MAG: hypothetical protein E7A62_07940 [Actinomycetaceae bacterium]|nr:hypothetical protein [Actinomycetaceae bacterium]MDU0970907.1 hypothetical protein [Actinomycetaceae bacterium]